MLLAGCATVEVGPEPGLEQKAQQPRQALLAREAPLTAQNGEKSTGWNLQTLHSQKLADNPDSTLTLERAWQLALENDPTYQAALSGLAAAQTESRLGRAAILPQVQAGYSRSQISGLRRVHLNGSMREGELDYDSTSAYIQLQQPLFNVERYAQYQGGQARARLGEAEFAVREYETAMRLIAAYVDAVAAEGALKLARALAESLEEQAATQDALFAKSEASSVDAQETRARLALARADVIAAEDARNVARRQLEAVIGRKPPPLLSLEHLTEDRARMSAPLLAWLERAQANGAAVRAARARLRVADTEVRRAGAQHLPTADLVMALSDADSENLDTLSQKSNTFTVGVHVEIPIFSGGFDTANHARRRHARKQAAQELRQTQEHMAAEVTRQYTAVQGGADRIAALISSVSSGEESLVASRYGYQYGINSNLDVLRMQDSLFQARHELLAARASWLEARIALAAAAGEPLRKVFVELDQLLWFTR